MDILEHILLIFALSLEAFAACTAYGAQGIHIPRRSALVIRLIGVLLLLVSLTAASGVRCCRKGLPVGRRPTLLAVMKLF